MVFSLNLIIKDLRNDNLININKRKNEYFFSCTCGINYCHHLDYIIHKISSDINNKICYDEYFKIIGFNSIEHLKISIKENDNYIHDVLLKFCNGNFQINCSCNNNECYYCKYAIIELISDYLKKKESMNNMNNDILMLKEIESDLFNLKF